MKYLLTTLALSSLGLAQAQKRPNIIWIFSDDHSYQTIGAYESRFQYLNPTPNIDRLANEGMRFDRCYVENSISAPSRSTLLTGKFSHMHGKTINKKSCLFDHNQQQFQKILQKNGYQTALIGKIHIDGKMQGFDYWEVLPGQGIYYNPTFITEKGKKTYKDKYVTEVITERALNWLDNERHSDEPFMLMVHHKAPHRNWEPDVKYMNKYKDDVFPEPDNLFDDYKTKTKTVTDNGLRISDGMNLDIDLKVTGEKYANDPKFAERRRAFAEAKLQGDELTRWKYQTYLRDYLRCIWSVDKSVGAILDWVEKNGLDENTIIMYSSDQGFYMGEHGWFDKRMMYEESFRTPLLARWKGTIKEGSINTDLVQNIDFAETFLELANAEIPKDEMQGRSLVPLLKGNTPKDWRTSLYYHYYEYPGYHSVRKQEGVFTKEYKLIRFYGEDLSDGEDWEYYDLRKDPNEMNNIYDSPKEKKRIMTLKKEMQKLRIHYKVPQQI